MIRLSIISRHTHTHTFRLSFGRAFAFIEIGSISIERFFNETREQNEKTQTQTIDNRNHPKLDESIQIIRVKITNQFSILIWNRKSGGPTLTRMRTTRTLCCRCFRLELAHTILGFRMFWQTAPIMGFNVINYSASVSAIEIYACYLWSIALLVQFQFRFQFECTHTQLAHYFG